MSTPYKPFADHARGRPGLRTGVVDSVGDALKLGAALDLVHAAQALVSHKIQQPWLSLKLDRVKKHFRPGHVSRRGIALDQHVRHTGKIRLGNARRSDHDDLAYTLALGRR